MEASGRNVVVDLELLNLLTACAQSHVEDIESGIEDGTYKAEENKDLTMKRHAVDASLELSEILCAQEIPPYLAQALATTGELLIRAAAVLGALHPGDQKRIQRLSEDRIGQGIRLALDAVAVLSPSTRESLRTHPPQGFNTL